MDPLRIAIIDDDPFVAAHLRLALADRLPDAQVFLIEDPIAAAGYDVYVIDNDFCGQACGGELHDRVRAIAPDATILAYSAELDTSFLRRLMRGGAREAYDKTSAADRDALIEAIANAREPGARGRRRRHPISAITSLLREWNLRLGARSSGSPQATPESGS